MVCNRTVCLEVDIQEIVKVSRNQYATRVTLQWEDGLAGDVRAGWRYVIVVQSSRTTWNRRK